MENRITAVGWIVNKLMKESTGFISLDALTSYTEQALEIEKEQMIEFANKVLYNAECSFTGKAYLEKDIEEIYNETYGK